MDMKRDIAKLQAATGKQIDRPVSGHDDRAPPAGLNSILILERQAYRILHHQLENSA